MERNFQFNSKQVLMLGLMIVLVLFLVHKSQPPTQNEHSSSGNSLPGGQSIGNCRDCISFSDIGVPVESDTGDYVDVNLGAKLSKLAQINSNWRITEGYPPTVRHLNFCHQNGICVDLGLYADKRTAAKLSQLCKDALNVGLTIVNEYSDPKLMSSDTSCPASNVFETTTGGHLHVQ